MKNKCDYTIFDFAVLFYTAFDVKDTFEGCITKMQKELDKYDTEQYVCLNCHNVKEISNISYCMMASFMCSYDKVDLKNQYKVSEGMNKIGFDVYNNKLGFCVNEMFFCR